MNIDTTFEATTEDSRLDFHMQRDMNISDVTYLPQQKVIIGRAPGGPKYLKQDENTSAGYTNEMAKENYGYNPQMLLRDIEFLKKLGVDTIVDLRHRKYESLECKKAEEEACKMQNINYLSIELDSAIPPTEEELEKFFDAIDNSSNDKKVYIHCHAGRDRTGIMSSCYLARYLGMDREEAFKIVFDNRLEREKSIPNHPYHPSIPRLKFMDTMENKENKERFFKILDDLKKQYYENKAC